MATDVSRENLTPYGGNPHWRDLHIQMIGPTAYGQMCDWQRYRRLLWGDNAAVPCDAPAIDILLTDSGNFAMCDECYRVERDWWESHCEPRDDDPDDDTLHCEAAREKAGGE